MSRLRARIAERLMQSQSTNAILTTFNEVNMKPVMDLRNKYKDVREGTRREAGLHVVLREGRRARAEEVPGHQRLGRRQRHRLPRLLRHRYRRGSPRGLVVPILRNADQMSLADIEKKIAEFGAKAKDGKLSLEELTGGTFSISNGGTFGSMLSTPIINPPQSAILGVHATKDRAVVEDGQIVIRPMNYLAMSYDHRIIDGREAVLGLVAMKEALEDPARLLLDL
jgi:2-oxoglutarate dehydrogenase E2 component (dihydrolipoamide succinyltransferase)